MKLALILLSGACTLPSCLSFNYIRSSLGEPVAAEAYEALEPQRAKLGECLATLGAPDLVWPSDDGSINLAWAWSDSHDWGFSVSLSFERFLNLEFELDSIDVAVQSVVLQFDQQLVLARISRGYLWDLAPSAQQSTAASRMMDNSSN